VTLSYNTVKIGTLRYLPCGELLVISTGYEGISVGARGAVVAAASIMLLPWLLLLFVVAVAIWGGVHTVRARAHQKLSHHRTPVEKF